MVSIIEELNFWFLNFSFKQPLIPSSYRITQHGCKGYNSVYRERIILPLTVNVLVYESPDLLFYIYYIESLLGTW